MKCSTYTQAWGIGDHEVFFSMWCANASKHRQGRLATQSTDQCGQERHMTITLLLLGALCEQANAK